jgi:hypothetical protein
VPDECGSGTTHLNLEGEFMHYQPGARVALVHTDDPYTWLRPGDQGTVVRHDETTGTVDVNWDSGSRLSMCLDAGDQIRLLPVDNDHTGDAAQTVR